MEDYLDVDAMYEERTHISDDQAMGYERWTEEEEPEDEDDDEGLQLPQIAGFSASDDGRFQCLSRTLPDGTHICITATDGMGYPTETDFLVCAYTSADGVGDSGALLAFIGVEENICIEDAVSIAIARSLAAD